MAEVNSSRISAANAQGTELPDDEDISIDFGELYRSLRQERKTILAAALGRLAIAAIAAFLFPPSSSFDRLLYSSQQ